jgi:hypothetical protein
MEFANDHETTTYTMLQQVLQNHCATHTLALPYAFVGCGRLLALVCAQSDDDMGDVDGLVAYTLAELTRETWARPDPPLAPFPAPWALANPLAQDTHTDTLFEALAQLFYDAVAADRVTMDGGCRIMVALMADLFAMLIHQGADTPEEVEAKIAHLRAPLLAQIHAYRQQQAQG